MAKYLDAEVRIPGNLGVRLKTDKVVARASTGAAKAIRSRWATGHGAQGRMPSGEGRLDDRGLYETGDMMRSVKGYWGRRRNKDGTKRRYVGPTGKDRRSGQRRALVYFVNVHKRQDLKATLPLGTDQNVADKTRQFAMTELKKQVATGETGLVIGKRRILV